MPVWSRSAGRRSLRSSRRGGRRQAWPRLRRRWFGGSLRHPQRLEQVLDDVDDVVALAGVDEDALAPGLEPAARVQRAAEQADNGPGHGDALCTVRRGLGKLTRA